MRIHILKQFNIKLHLPNTTVFASSNRGRYAREILAVLASSSRNGVVHCFNTIFFQVLCNFPSTNTVSLMLNILIKLLSIDITNCYLTWFTWDVTIAVTTRLLAEFIIYQIHSSSALDTSVAGSCNSTI